MTANVHLEPWSEEGLELLHRLNAPEMTTHLGGPETEDQVVSRHGRYLVLDGGRMFRIVVDGVSAGSVGFWEKEWKGEKVHEVGWGVLPEFQGRGVAVAAASAAVGKAREAAGGRWVHAFPSVDHPASNAVCRRIGLTLLEEVEFEYPPGHFMQCNDWGLAP